MRKMGVWFLALLPLGFLFSNGCGGDTAERTAEQMIEKAIEQAAEEDGEKVDVEIGEGALRVRSKTGIVRFKADDDSVVMKTDEGSMRMGAGTSLPAEFPKDVPVYDGANILHSMVMGEMVMATLETGDSFPAAVAAYEKKCPGHGWTKVGSVTGTTGDPVRVLNYRKGERSLIVSISRDSDKGKTVISLTISRG